MAEADDGFAGMAKEWDSCQAVRTHLRAGGALMEGENPDIKSTVANKPVLLPIVKWMAGRPQQKLPEVEAVRTEVRNIYVVNKVDADSVQVQGDGWLIRKYLGFLKMKVRRREVSIESWSHMIKFDFPNHLNSTKHLKLTAVSQATLTIVHFYQGPGVPGTRMHSEPSFAGLMLLRRLCYVI